MKHRSGQVVLYFAFVLVAIVILVMMNMEVFLSVRAKNRLMNAVDNAAIAVAKYQGECLNQLASNNVEHIKAIVEGVPWDVETDNIREFTRNAPLEGLKIATEVAAKWGFDNVDGDSIKVLSEVAESLRTFDGEVWQQHAYELEERAKGATVYPRKVDMPGITLSTHDLRFTQGFYEAIKARAWCWFALYDRDYIWDWDSSHQSPNSDEVEVETTDNSVIYSLQVEFKPLETITDERLRVLCRAAGYELELLTNSWERLQTEDFAFYDKRWEEEKWSTILDKAGIEGSVKPEYDVKGAAASCRLCGKIPCILASNYDAGSKNFVYRDIEVTAEAKPLGYALNLANEPVPVTEFDRLILPSTPNGKVFTDAGLVLVDSVATGGVGTEPEWYHHIMEHMPEYFATGPKNNGCQYCRQLVWWEDAAHRASIRDWIRDNGETCKVSSKGEMETGGYYFAH